MLSVLAQEGEDVVKDAFSWSAALQYSVLVVTLLTGLLFLARALNKRIDKAAMKAVKASNDARAEWQTSNGHRAGEVLEEIKTIACTNRDLAQQSLKLGIQNRDDLIDHRHTPADVAHGRADE